MTDNDLHSRLVSSLTARLDRARAATPGPWHTPGPDSVGQWVIYDDQWAVAEVRAYSHDDPMSNKPGARGPAYIDSDANAAYIAANAPDVEIRRVEATLRVVQRHAPCSDCNGDGGDYVHATMCHACAEVGEYCGLVLALAAGEGIEP